MSKRDIVKRGITAVEFIVKVRLVETAVEGNHRGGGKPVHLHSVLFICQSRGVKYSTYVAPVRVSDQPPIAENHLLAPYAKRPAGPRGASQLYITLVEVERVFNVAGHWLPAVTRRTRILHLEEKAQPFLGLDGDIQPEPREVIGVIESGNEVDPRVGLQSTPKVGAKGQPALFSVVPIPISSLTRGLGHRLSILGVLSSQEKRSSHKNEERETRKQETWPRQLQIDH